MIHIEVVGDINQKKSY